MKGGLSRWVVLLALAACAHAPVAPPRDYVDAVGYLPTATGHPLPPIRGQVLLVWFFATGCFPCMASYETFVEVQKEWAKRGVQVLAVGMDLDAAQSLPLFAKIRAPPFPVLLPTPEIRAGQSPFGHIAALPSTFLIGRDGRLLVGWAGVASKAQLDALLEHATAR